jgi:hypothetical protein
LKIAHVLRKKNENIENILYKMGYVSDLKRKDSYILLFTDTHDQSETEIVVDDIENVHLFWKPVCADCGEIIEMSSNRKVVCSNCKKKRDQEKKRRYKATIRTQN